MRLKHALVAFLTAGLLAGAGCGERQVGSDGWQAHALAGTPTAIWSGEGEVLVAFWAGDSGALLQRGSEGWVPFTDRTWSYPILSLAGKSTSALSAAPVGGISQYDGIAWSAPRVTSRVATPEDDTPYFSRIVGVEDEMMAAGCLAGMSGERLAVWDERPTSYLWTVRLVPEAVQRIDYPPTRTPTQPDKLAWSLRVDAPNVDFVRNAQGDTYLLSRKPAVVPALIVLPAATKIPAVVAMPEPVPARGLATCAGVDLALLGTRGVYLREASSWRHVGELPLPGDWETSHLICLGPELFYITTRQHEGEASRLYRLDPRGARVVLENDCPLERLVSTNREHIFVYDACATVFESEASRPGA